MQMHKILQIMNNNKPSKGDFINPLPLIQTKKQTLPLEQQQRYFFKNKQTFNSESQLSNEKFTKNDISFLFSKEQQQMKNRMVLTPNKVELRQKLYTLEQDIFNQYMDRQQLQRMPSPSIKTSDKLINDKPLKPSDRAYLYQPFRKSVTKKERLKPIVSQIHKFSAQEYLSVQKIVFSEGDRSKKSYSVAANELEKEKEKFLINSYKLIKGTSLHKEKSHNEQFMIRNQARIKNYQESIEVRQLNSKKQKQKEDKVQLIKYEQQGTSLQQNIKIQMDIRLSQKKRHSPSKPNRRKLIIPFETYYYRDMLWKINFTNELYIETPLQYEHRLKVYVGKGNNSCMVSGLISRRPWYAFTDKIQEANFVWTQLKLLSYYKVQEQSNQEIMRSEQKNGYQPDSFLTIKDSKKYNDYMANYFNSEEHSDERMISRSKAFKYKKMIKPQQIKQIKMQNHFINNYVIGNKKALFNTMTNYYQETNQEVFDYLPLTFHITDGMEDKKYFQFLRYYHKRAKEITRNNSDKSKQKQYNAWIVKPGQNSNRGNGIKMCLTLEDIKSVLKKKQIYKDGSCRTYIVQAYIQRPLLYFKRKFDLRHYIMITCINGIIKGYWYRYGYVRTTSSQYSLNANDGAIHLTNDAVQKNLPEYGKYQKGNKISYDDLHAYIEKYHKKKKENFHQNIYPKMKKIATDAMRACSGGIDPKKLQNNFQIFGMDFMIDANLDVWLIQINSNPCLELSCPLLSSLIPKMVENALQLTLDAMFPPPVRYTPKGVHYLKQLQKQNKFELVYDERIQKLYTGSLQVLDNKLLQQQDDTFQDCGDEWQDN